MGVGQSHAEVMLPNHEKFTIASGCFSTPVQTGWRRRRRKDEATVDLRLLSRHTDQRSRCHRHGAKHSRLPAVARLPGPPGRDIAAIEVILLRVSRLVEELPEIVELDLNPVFVLPLGKGCAIVDARIRITA